MWGYGTVILENGLVISTKNVHIPHDPETSIPRCKPSINVHSCSPRGVQGHLEQHSE